MAWLYYLLFRFERFLICGHHHNPFLHTFIIEVQCQERRCEGVEALPVDVLRMTDNPGFQ